jgi:hypothetical protein
VAARVREWGEFFCGKKTKLRRTRRRNPYMSEKMSEENEQKKTEQEKQKWGIQVREERAVA